MFKDSFDSLKKAFPTLADLFPMNNKTLQQIARFLYDDVRNHTQFSTAQTFLSNELSPEGAKLMKEKYGFLGDYMQDINTPSYRKYLKKKDFISAGKSSRPKKGMSEFITNLKEKIENSGGTIYYKETVESIGKEMDTLTFALKTTKYTVKANKTVLTSGPAALKKITGDVTQRITGQDIFKSIVSVPAFHGAALYEKAWWNDSVAAEKKNALQPLDMFISSSGSYCLGTAMPDR